MEQSGDRVTVYLAIESTELQPSALTDRLKVHPDRKWTIGEARGKTGKKWDCHGWVLEATVRSEDCKGCPPSELVTVAMNRFEKRVEKYSKAISGLGDSVQVYVVLTALAKKAPGIECSRSFIKLLNALGGTFQIDLQGM